MLQHKFLPHAYLFGNVNFDFKQHAVAYTSKKIPVKGLQDLLVSTKVVQTGSGSAGTFKLTANLYDGPADSPGSVTLLSGLDIVTAISSNPGAGTFYRTLTLAEGQPTGAGHNAGTVVASIGTILRGASHIELVLTITQDSDAATSCVGQMNVAVSNWK